MTGVAVIGAAGRTGRHVLTALARRGCAATALIHRPEQADVPREHGAGATAVVDLEDPASVRAALDGVTRVHIVPPLFHPGEAALVDTVVRAAQDVGAERLTYQSVLHPDTPGLVPYSLDAPFSVMDVADVADASAAVLLGDRAHVRHVRARRAGAAVHGRADRPGRGDARPSADGSRHRPVGQHGVPIEWTRSAWADVCAMWSHYDAHGLVGNPAGARIALGREPASFAEAVARSSSS